MKHVGKRQGFYRFAIASYWAGLIQGRFAARARFYKDRLPPGANRAGRITWSSIGWRASQWVGLSTIIGDAHRVKLVHSVAQITSRKLG